MSPEDDTASEPLVAYESLVGTAFAGGNSNYTAAIDQLHAKVLDGL